MTSEPHRLQYLEAMGLTAWVARYRLPNALASEACAWEQPVNEVRPRAHGERLHALLEDAGEATAQENGDNEPVVRPPGGPRKARALLGELVPEEQRASSVPSSPSSDGTPTASPSDTPAEALRFTWQVSCLDGRWLVVLPRDVELSGMEYRLLGNILRAAGVVPASAPVFETFRWPQLEGVSVETPLEEARDGLRAFLNGRRQRGWQPEQLLVFGGDAVLDSLLGLGSEQSELLSLPVWQGPDLRELVGAADAKRALWPRLQGWQQHWNNGDEA